MNQREKTEEEAWLALSSLCAKGEHCQFEMTEKMRRWGLDETAQARVMQRLVEGRYVDDARFARAFIYDKIRYNHWGRRKVEQALWQKHIDQDICRPILDTVDTDEYLRVLRPLVRQKRQSTRARSAYELRAKLVRFAMQRGFTMDIIAQVIDGADETATPTDFDYEAF